MTKRQPKGCWPTLGNGLLKTIVILLFIGWGIVSLLGFFGIISYHILPVETYYWWNDGLNDSSFHFTLTETTYPSWSLWLIYISLMLIIGIPIWLLGHHVFSATRYSNRSRITFLIIWCIALITAGVAGLLIDNEEGNATQRNYYHRGWHRWHCWRITSPEPIVEDKEHPGDFIFPTTRILQ